MTVCNSDTSSCGDRCGSLPGVVECGCDVDCMNYGDCCLDYEAACPEMQNSNISSTKIETQTLDDMTAGEIEEVLRSRVFRRIGGIHLDETCVSLPNNRGHAIDAQMVTTCQIKNVSEPLLAMCNMTQSDPRFPYLIYVPVLAKTYVFRNVYCMLCNGLMESDIRRYLEFEFGDCTVGDDDLGLTVYNEGYDKSLSSIMAQCNMYFLYNNVTKAMVSRHKCRGSIDSLVSTCSPDTDINEEARKACSVYKMPVGSDDHYDRFTYKKVH